MVYKVGSFIFEIINKDVPIPINLNKFIVNDTPQYHYVIEIVDHINLKETSFQVQKENIKIVKNGEFEKRYLYLLNDSIPYAVYEEIDKQHAIVQVNKEYIEYFDVQVDPMFVSLLALERHIYSYHEFILHSASMIIHDQAILFTAPSGVGKSTQADLWKTYRNTTVMNGDRNLLVKKCGKYYAKGWPVCGSSKICFNEEYPIKAIVILSQAKVNTIQIPSTNECIKKLLREITVNYHNMQFLDQALNFIDDIIKNVPIYHLQCDISEDAVICLENKLKEDGLWNEK